MSVQSILAPLIQNQIFTDEETAVRELVHSYIQRQIERLRGEIQTLEDRYGMGYEQFDLYLRERSQLLVSDFLTSEERHLLGQAVMEGEEDWLEWKAQRELLDSWLDLL